MPHLMHLLKCRYNSESLNIVIVDLFPLFPLMHVMYVKDSGVLQAKGASFTTGIKLNAKSLCFFLVI